ncbi:MAG: pyruvate kinase alpha/beta domain-containing protein, partial [Gemmatimonadota bacterium]
PPRAAAGGTAAPLLGAPGRAASPTRGCGARGGAARRPGGRSMVLTDQPRTYRQLALIWGVVPFLVAPAETYQDMLTIARGLLLRHGFAEAGERILVTAGVPFNIPGTTNLLKVETV